MSLRPTSKFLNVFDLLQKIKTFDVSFIFNNVKTDHIDVSNFIFKLHSKVTVTMLLVGTLFSSLKIFGEPIECLVNGQSSVSKELLEKYCWMEGSFSIDHTLQESNYQTKQLGKAGIDYAYPGVTNAHNGKRINHKYYQWVYFTLIIQAILFYMPKYYWNCKEAEVIKRLIYKLKLNSVEIYNIYVQKSLLQELFDCLLVGDNYLASFIFCELWYVFNLIFQFWFVNVFLGGAFKNLGWSWFHYVNSDNGLDHSYDPLVQIFPRLVKCSFNRYGPTGEIENQDAACFLPLNIINEKIYVVMWIWFAFLFIFTSIYLFFHLLLVNFVALRYVKLRYHAPNCHANILRSLCKNAGNWFILEYIAINIKPNYFRSLINQLMEEFFDSNRKPLYHLSMRIKYGVAIKEAYNEFLYSIPNYSKNKQNVNMLENSLECNVPNSKVSQHFPKENRKKKHGKMQQIINNCMDVNLNSGNTFKENDFVLDLSDWENQEGAPFLPNNKDHLEEIDKDLAIFKRNKKIET